MIGPDDWRVVGEMPVILQPGETCVLRMELPGTPLWGEFLVTAGEYDADMDGWKIDIVAILDGHPTMLKTFEVDE